MRKRFAALLCLLGSGITFQVYGQLQTIRFDVKADNPTTAVSSKTVNSTSLRTNDVAASAPPHIIYPTPQVYGINQPIPPLTPFNTGGAVPSNNYGQVSKITDNGISYFSIITGVVMDSGGNIFVADYGINQIRKITPAGAVSIFAGQSGATGAINGNGNVATFNLPDALSIDKNNNLYVSEAGNNMIRKITPLGIVSTFAGNGNIGKNDGAGTAASFYSPRGLCFDNAGNLYVADQGNNMIRKITADGTVSIYAGTGNAGFTNGARLSATFNTPTAVVADAAGNLFVSDASNNVIRKIATDGTVSTFATGLNFPREARFDGSGNLYVNDQYSNSIKKISPAGVVTKMAGSGATGYTDGNANTASFTQLIGMGYANDGSLIVGDGLYVRKISLGGVHY